MPIYIVIHNLEFPSFAFQASDFAEASTGHVGGQAGSKVQGSEVHWFNVFFYCGTINLWAATFVREEIICATDTPARYCMLI